MISGPPTTTVVAHQRFLASRYFDSLDGLRGMSIIPVVWHHAAGHMPGVLGRGSLGVEFFFAISGFLITTLLLRERDRSGAVSLSGFYLRRTLRIFPLYYAVLSLYVALVWTLDAHTAAGRQFFANLPSYLTYTSNWFVSRDAGERVIFYFAWSLATEEQFYLVWPSVFRFSRPRWIAPAAMVGILAVGEWARWVTDAGGFPANPLWLRVLASIASPICLGGLAAYLLHDRGTFVRLYAVLGRWWSAPLTLAALAWAIAFEETPMLVIALAMTALVIACVVRGDHGLNRLMRLRPLRYVGEVSYGVYLLHMLAINLVRRVLLPGAGPVLVVVVALPLAVLLAGLSHRHFERRFMLLKDRWSRVPRPALAPTTSPG